MSKLLWFLTLSISFAFASVEHAPKNFSQNGKNFVFIDMLKADYDVVYDLTEKETKAVSKIEFEINAEGYPLFDLQPEAQKIFLGKQQVQSLSVKLPDGGQMKALNAKLSPGVYSFEVHHKIVEN